MLKLGFLAKSLSSFMRKCKREYEKLTLEPNSTSERKMRRLSKSSENALSPLTLNVPVKFGQIKVLVPRIPALPQSVVVHYHLLCQCASSAAPCRQERRGRGFGDQSAQKVAASAPGDSHTQSERLPALR